MEFIFFEVGFVVEVVIEDGYVDKLSSVVKFKIWFVVIMFRICFFLYVKYF